MSDTIEKAKEEKTEEIVYLPKTLKIEVVAEDDKYWQLQVKEQTHKNHEFGINGNNFFTCSEYGVTFYSEAYPEFYTDLPSFFVQGNDAFNNDKIIWIKKFTSLSGKIDTQILDAIFKAVEKYNSYFEGHKEKYIVITKKCSICKEEAKIIKSFDSVDDSNVCINCVKEIDTYPDIKCNWCKKTIATNSLEYLSNAHTILGQTICSDCLDKYFTTCEICGTYHKNKNTTLCGACERTTRYCYNCDREIINEKYVPISIDNVWCEKCLDIQNAKVNEKEHLVQCPDCGFWHKKKYGCDICSRYFKEKTCNKKLLSKTTFSWEISKEVNKYFRTYKLNLLSDITEFYIIQYLKFCMEVPENPITTFNFESNPKDIFYVTPFYDRFKKFLNDRDVIIQNKLEKFFIMYLFVSSFGEARHFNKVEMTDTYGFSWAPDPSFITDRPRAWFYALDMINTDSQETLLLKAEDLYTVFSSGSWALGFGGKKWADIINTLINYLKGNLNKIIFIDTNVSLAHNGQLYLDKLGINIVLLKILLDFKFSGKKWQIEALVDFLSKYNYTLYNRYKVGFDKVMQDLKYFTKKGEII